MPRRTLRHAEARGGEELVFETRILAHAGFLRTAKLHGIQRTQKEEKRMQKIMTKLLLVLAITAVAAFGTDNSLGTWKLAVEKSKYTPGPFPFKNLTVVREASGTGVNSAVTGERTDGSAVNYRYTAKVDGTAFDVRGSARTWTGGAYHSIGRTMISTDGKTITLNLKGAGSDGKPATGTFVYDKQ